MTTNKSRKGKTMKAAPADDTRARVEMILPEGKSYEVAMTEAMIGPIFRHAATSLSVAKPLVSGIEDITPADATGHIIAAADATASGSNRFVSDSLVSQAHTLDTLTTELMRRAWLNVGEYPDAFQRYMTMALKAQSNCRATLEALARLHQPREQVVRHVHVYQGGQAVVAEEVHHHGGAGNANIADRPHASGVSLADQPALLGHDAGGRAVPITGSPGKAPVPNARGSKGQRRPARQRKCAETRPAISGSREDGASTADGGL